MRKEKQEELTRYINEFKTNSVTNLNINNRFLTIDVAKYQLNNGKEIIREKLIKNGNDGSAVIIVPVTVDNEMILTIEPRVNTLEGVGIGFPAGYVEKGETCVEAASRELLEETGYRAHELIEIDGFYQDEGCSSAYNTIVLAKGCVKVSDQMLDKDEFIHYFLCNIEEAYEMLYNKTIKGANSKLALLEVKELIKK